MSHALQYFHGYGNYIKHDGKKHLLLAHKCSHKVTLTINQTTSSSFQKGLSYSWSFSPSRHFHDLPFTCNKKASVHDTIIICNGHVMQKSST